MLGSIVVNCAHDSALHSVRGSFINDIAFLSFLFPYPANVHALLSITKSAVISHLQTRSLNSGPFHHCECEMLFNKS